MMDKVNGKDFFIEFDRKKEEMFSLIQDSEDMIQELNNMSDYVVTTISEKNQEFFNRYRNLSKAEQELEFKKDTIQSFEAVSVVQNLTDSVLESKPVSVSISVPENVPDIISSPKNDFAQKDEENQGLLNKQVSLERTEQAEDIVVKEKSKLVLNNRRKEVLQMIEQGLSNDEIAEKLKMGKGEIGLIRGLSNMYMEKSW